MPRAGLGKLVKLQNLNLEGCSKTKLPESFISLKALPDDAFMMCCKHVARLPESIIEHSLFKDAAKLDFSSSKLVALPDSELHLRLTTLHLVVRLTVAPPLSLRRRAAGQPR